MLRNREVILAKIESVYNTDPTPVAATDAILVQEVNWGFEGLRMAERPAISATIGKLQRVYAGALRKLTFSCELKGAGATYSSSVFPEIDPLLRACGLAATGSFSVGTENWQYQPASTGHESITIYHYMDGLRYITTGCRGAVNFEFNVGEVPKANFEFIGHSVAPTDQTLVTPTYDAVVPPPVLGAAFVDGAYAAIVQQLTVDLSNSVTMNEEMNASDGYGEIRITERDVQGSFNPESVLIATYNPEADLRAGTQTTLTTGNIGATQYNRVKMTCQQAYKTDVQPGDRNAVRVWDLPFMCDRSGDNEMILEFN